MNPQPGVKRLAKLYQKKHREAERLFLAEGESLVREAPSPPVAAFYDHDAVRKLSTLSTPTGPIAAFPFLDVTVEDLLLQRDRLLLLDGVQDPGNVGTAIRSAHAFEAGVVLSRGTADLYNPKTVRATMGSIFHAPIAREVDAREFVERTRSAGFVSLAAVPAGGDALRETLTDRVVLVVGTEGRGISEEVLETCDGTVSIPSRAASLNAGVAASILLYEAYLRVLP
jgi:RNA methyltransferase, TrmH family